MSRNPDQQRAYEDWVADARDVRVEDELVRRNVKNARGEDETVHLRLLEDILLSKKSQSDHWLDLYRGAWQGDLTKIFEAAKL